MYIVEIFEVGLYYMNLKKHEYIIFPIQILFMIIGIIIFILSPVLGTILYFKALYTGIKRNNR